MNFTDSDIELGGRRVIGQHKAKEMLEQVIESDRISHAYLFSGPPGIGKKAMALAFAEAINGIDHLTDLKGQAFSKKSSWYSHPDIRVFLPLPTTSSVDELASRIELLGNDPYEIVDFGLRPSLTEETSASNKKAFYSISYFNETIRPAAFLKPNEGHKNIIILCNVEKMRKEAANAFLKLLEEPSDKLMFLLTTDNVESLLPTIISRCQIIPLSPLSTDEIRRGLIEKDGLNEKDALYLSRVSGGNYAQTRFYDVATLKTSREEVIDFLRSSYKQDATLIINTAEKWHGDLSLEGQLALLNILQAFIRDIYVFRTTNNPETITNVDQLEVIQNFCKSLGKARLNDMINEIEDARRYLYQNVQAKLIFTVLAIRFSYLMRGYDSVVSDEESWKHMPSYQE